MNNVVSQKQVRPSRRIAAVLGVLIATVCLVPLAYAVFGPGQIPTVLTVSGAAVRAGQWTTASARLTRLDSGQPLSGHAINFWIGNPTYPSSRIGTRVITDANGNAKVRVYGDRSWVGKSVIVLAEYEPRWPFATPLPWGRVTVSK